MLRTYHEHRGKYVINDLFHMTWKCIFRMSSRFLLSVNGKGGAVVLDAQDVGALPAPVAPQAGALLRVLSIRSDGSLVVDTVTPAALKTLLEAT